MILNSLCVCVDKFSLHGHLRSFDIPVRVVLEEKIEVKERPPGRQARDVRELGFALIRRCHSGETGWIRRCYLESVFKEFQKSESYVGDEEPRLSDGDLADSSSSSSSSDSD